VVWISTNTSSFDPETNQDHRGNERGRKRRKEGRWRRARGRRRRRKTTEDRSVEGDRITAVQASLLFE
jgi:hypothetical protein